MKNIFKFGLFALFLSMAACSDATDIIQESELGEDAAWQTVDDLSSGLSGAYARYAPDAGGNGDGDAILFNDLFTDNIKRGLAGNGHGAGEYNFILQTNTTAPNAMWNNRYSTLNQINRVLRATDRLYEGFSTTDKATADGIKGQLLALRALCHFDLFQYFTTDYNNPAALSVIVMDFVPELTDSFERNTVAEVLTSVNADIDAAYDLLGTTNESAVNLINVNVVKAIEARVSIFTGDNARAEFLTGELLTAKPLALPSDYMNMFGLDLALGGRNAIGQSNGEVIFKLTRLIGGGRRNGSLFYANDMKATGSPIFEVSQELYQAFDADDIRRDVVVNREGALNVTTPASTVPNGTDPDAPANNGILLIGKYPGRTADFLINDVIIFRSSEMLLIRAEAQARQGNLTGAAASIQALRTARYAANTVPPAPTFANEDAALLVILNERRKELAFEGHRYLDLKRIGGELGLGIDRLASDAATFGAPTELPANDYRFTFPIPTSELNANNVITQNPGYPANN